MKFFVVVACLVGSALARPDIGILAGTGRAHTTSYGAPLSNGYIPPAPTAYNGHSAIDYAGANTNQNFGFEHVNVGSDGGNGFHSSGGQVDYQKHIYFYEAPESEEVITTRVVQTPAQSQRHHKVIFIKAPAAPQHRVQFVGGSGGSEEKTVVYVLLKNAEGGQEISVPAEFKSTVAKPEVFFIKYNGKQDAHAKIQAALQQGGTGAAGGSHGQEHPDANSLVASIREYQKQQQGSFGASSGGSFGGSSGGGSFGGSSSGGSSVGFISTTGGNGGGFDYSSANTHTSQQISQSGPY